MVRKRTAQLETTVTFQEDVAIGVYAEYVKLQNRTIPNICLLGKHVITVCYCVDKSLIYFYEVVSVKLR